LSSRCWNRFAQDLECALLDFSGTNYYFFHLSAKLNPEELVS